MNLFDVGDFVAAVRSLSNTARNCEARRALGEGARAVSEDDQRLVWAYVTIAHDLCVKYQFCDGAGRTRDTLRAFDPRMQGSVGPRVVDYSWAAADLKNVSDALIREVEKLKFVLVPHDRTEYLDRPDLFGEAVSAAFPSATNDIREAGNCLAAGCDTAAVFHLMRAVEWALRRFCLYFGFKQVRNKWNKATKRYDEYVPIAYATWEKVLSGLKPAIDGKIDKMRRKDEKQAAQECFLGAWQEIQAIKDVWRNHVAHTRKDYGPKDADAVMDHVRRLMTSLAVKFGEDK